MKSIYLFILLFVFNSGVAQTKQESQKTITPILINKSALSGIGLKQIDQPNDPGKEFYQRRICWGDELGIFIVSTNSYTNKMKNFPFDEYVYMLHGEAEVRPLTGEKQRFKSREHFFAPKGFTGEWEIIAGENLHYELSVISTKRADSTATTTSDQHLLIDPLLLAGTHITFDQEGSYQKEIVQGAELTFSLHAEKPRSVEIDNSKEQVVHVLSGEITITTPDDLIHTFHTGDFFIIPSGLKGQWKSSGHSLAKYLVVQRSW